MAYRLMPEEARLLELIALEPTAEELGKMALEAGLQSDRMGKTLKRLRSYQLWLTRTVTAANRRTMCLTEKGKLALMHHQRRTRDQGLQLPLTGGAR